MNADLSRETRKQARLEKLGTENPRCGTCGETDWRCHELHHVAGQARDELVAILCANCHRKVTDDQKDHPYSRAAPDPTLDAIGHFLLGLADMLRLIVDKLVTFGTILIARTPVAPPHEASL